ncbi:MAG: alpha/beta hydrolase, partial [Propionibacteriaceae bacterium]|nr:alpha/beta hydrolase [Propionibacteriaceae bacterium]
MEARASRPGPAAMISKWRTVLTRQTPDPAGGSDPARELPGWSSAWVPDRWLDGFETLTYAMVGCPHLPEEGSGHLVSTLVRYGAPRRRRAVLYLHGWNEYFFQRHEAEFFEQLGYDFYAVDLHRYGRSLQAGELPGYMESVEDYYEEIDAALALIKRDHDRVILYGHSTGGLIASLYASDRPKQFVGVLLNSPWIDMQGSALFRALTPPLVRGLAVASPTMTLPASENDLYGRSLHQDFEGEWDFDLTLKRIESQPLRPGWVKAVVDGHDRVGAGLRIDAPVLVVTSARS